MKKLIIIFACAFFIFQFVTGCTKKEATNAATNTMAAVVDSNLFNATGASVFATKVGYQLTITGITPGNVIIELIINNFSGFDGTNNLDGYIGTAVLDSGNNPHATITGSVNFTSTFPNLVGTFYFMCTDSSYVTHGRFNCVAP